MEFFLLVIYIVELLILLKLGIAILSPPLLYSIHTVQCLVLHVTVQRTESCVH